MEHVYKIPAPEAESLPAPGLVRRTAQVQPQAPAQPRQVARRKAVSAYQADKKNKIRGLKLELPKAVYDEFYRRAKLLKGSMGISISGCISMALAAWCEKEETGQAINFSDYVPDPKNNPAMQPECSLSNNLHDRFMACYQKRFDEFGQSMKGCVREAVIDWCKKPL